MEAKQAIRVAIEAMRHELGIIKSRPNNSELATALHIFERVNDKKPVKKEKCRVLPNMGCPECVGGQLILRRHMDPIDLICGGCGRVFTPARILMRILNGG